MADVSGVDLVPSASYSDGETPSPGPSGDGGASSGLTTSRRRRKPSPAEQARREAWGKRWGQLVKDATRGIREA